jgi:hypothetical protein
MQLTASVLFSLRRDCSASGPDRLFFWIKQKFDKTVNSWSNKPLVGPLQVQRLWPLGSLGVSSL